MGAASPLAPWPILGQSAKIAMREGRLKQRLSFLLCLNPKVRLFGFAQAAGLRAVFLNVLPNISINTKMYNLRTGQNRLRKHREKAKTDQRWSCLDPRRSYLRGSSPASRRSRRPRCQGYDPHRSNSRSSRISLLCKIVLSNCDYN